LNSGSNGDSFKRQITLHSGGVHTGERFVIPGASDAPGSCTRLVLLYVMTDLVHQPLDQYEAGKCVAGPIDSRC
jgi:hypothetical protein